MTQFSIAIVGAGPAGYFAAQALQDLQNPSLKFSIDLFEKLPTPWGLVRSGVAPDHPRIKSVSKVFERIASQDGFRLLANVCVGSDISLTELKRFYDAVVVAIGTPLGKRLGIPGEQLGNVISSADFVRWYNGHPEGTNLKISLSGSRAMVIGAGNVALDVARLLSLDPKELDSTDIANHALAALHDSSIRDVYVVARRGAEDVAFTASELRELSRLDSVNVEIDETDLQGSIQHTEGVSERHIRSKLETMRLISQTPSKNGFRKLQFLFQHSPVSIHGTERVEFVTFETPRGQIQIDCDLVITAIGYLPQSIPGLQVQGSFYSNQDGWVTDNLYVVGWAKHGPQGVVGTNKSDALAVMRKLVDRLAGAKPPIDVVPILQEREVEVVMQKDWNVINKIEVMKGSQQGRPREKFTSVPDMFAPLTLD